MVVMSFSIPNHISIPNIIAVTHNLGVPAYRREKNPQALGSMILIKFCSTASVKVQNKTNWGQDLKKISTY